MREHLVRACAWIRGTPVVSPRGFLLLAAVPVVLLGVLHLLGAREFTGVLCLTAPPGWSLGEAAVVGGAYVVAWFLAIAVSPVLVLAAGVFAMLLRGGPRSWSDGASLRGRATNEE